MLYRSKIFTLICFFVNTCLTADVFQGPDPWNSKTNELPSKFNDIDVPPDLKTPLKTLKSTETKAFGDWWFRRILAIVLKSGQVKKNEDKSVEVSLQMLYDEERWNVLNEYLKSENALTDVMFRRSVGYVEEAIYKPSITEQIIMEWSDYIQFYIIEYKDYITWTFGTLAAIGVVLWLWQHISHKHVIIIVFVLMYIYEVIISYKEAEKKELEKFLSALNTCKWYFWTSECEVPSPDPLVFMKYMNPLKIGIRMFTSLISEPILTLNTSIKIIVESMTDGLWFPFNRIAYMIIIAAINISLIYLLVMVVFNFIFNIGFNFNFLGIISLGVKRRDRNIFSQSNNQKANQQQEIAGDTIRLTGERLDRFLQVYAGGLSNGQNRKNTNMQFPSNGNSPALRRSASTGRLPDIISTQDRINNTERLCIKGNVRKRHNAGFNLGGGDH